MNVLDYLKTHSIEDLKNEFSIEVRDYEDRVVLNYSQIESPRFDAICDECRALILWKPRNPKQEWRVAARSFSRFYNVNEDKNTDKFPIDSRFTRIESKLDGSIISCYWDEYNQRWQPASRSCAFAEGTSVLGNTFSHIFFQSIRGTKVMDFLNSDEKYKNITWVFELTSPETRVVTNYPEYKSFLIAARWKQGQELCGDALDTFAKEMGVQRPIRFKFNSLTEAIEKVNSLPSMEEGFVLVYEGEDAYWRMKLKNTKYLAIAHLRGNGGNGGIAANRLLTLVLKNDYEEFVSYFPEYKKYFEFVEKLYLAAIQDVMTLWETNKDKVTQKDYALAIIPHCKYDWQKGMLFELRKGKTWEDCKKECDPKKLAKSMNLKEKIQKEFAIVLDKDETT